MMKRTEKTICSERKAVVLIIAMIFILVFSMFAISMAAMSGTSVEVSSNQHKINSALTAAQSGLEYGRYLASSYVPVTIPSDRPEITDAEADQVWSGLCDYIQANAIGGAVVSDDNLVTSAINFGATDAAFQVRFYRYDDDPNTIWLEGIGVDGQVKRQVSINLKITRDNKVLSYAIASKGRMWLTGDSTIHGNIYSEWQYQNISPFNMTSDSTVEGTINTILSNINPNTGKAGPDLYADKLDSYGNPVLDAQGNRVKIKMPYDLETLDANGNPVYDDQGNKVISPTDEIQGQCEDINYGVNYGDEAVNMPGMKISDYDTSGYKNQTTTIPNTTYNYTVSHGHTTLTTVREYFPHAAGNYGRPSSSGSRQLDRAVCEHKTLTDAKVDAGKNALFKNCTFEGVLYIDCGGTGGTYNNVRFENCVFNGPIITNTPNYSDSTNWWMKNCLYFTGEETFQNSTSVPATILAPNFNVNLGNTNPNSGENNVLTGAIVGGIVDIRGNAEIYGTVISMYDTSGYSSGYVNNIGATSDDGGSETTVPGDVGVINITPDPDKLLPSGVMSPIVIKPSQDTYSEE